MGIVGGGGNIAISTSLPLSFCVLCCKHLIVYGIHIAYFFMLARGFGFRMWRLTLARGGLFPLSADYSVVMCGAWPGTLVT